MAWFPGAIRKEVKRHDTPRTRDRGVCLHIAVSEGASLFNYFNTPGNPTSHFYVRYDGDVEQYVQTQYQAPANLQGNPTMISVETQGGVVPNRKWTAAQVQTLAELCAWCAQVHNIPLIPMPSSRPAARGIGYHRLGVDPWRIDEGELWSKAYGKTCPEDQRIEQIPGIITRANQIANPPTTGDGAMAWTDAQITQHLANQQQLIDLLEAQVYDRTETRKNTSLTATRLGTTLGADTKATRENTAASAGFLEQITENTTPVESPPEEPPLP